MPFPHLGYHNNVTINADMIVTLSCVGLEYIMRIPKSGGYSWDKW